MGGHVPEINYLLSSGSRSRNITSVTSSLNPESNSLDRSPLGLDIIWMSSFSEINES